MKKEPILIAENIVNRFGTQTVHDGVNLTINRGEIVGIVGGSGAGKSVLLKTLIGLHQPNEGNVTIAGKPINTLRPAQIASLFGVLFQQGALFSSMTVENNIMLPIAEHTTLKKAERKQLAALKLALVGLSPETALKTPSELSGGMIKRASLARALALDPEILFLDEPTSGLDPLAANEFDQLVKELNQSLGITIIMITHDLNSLFSVCDRAAVLVDKKVILDTLPHILKNKNPWIQQFFGGARGHGAAITAEEETHATR